MIVKNKCQYCGNGIEFDAEQDGQSIECPHCQKQVVLMVPKARPISLAQIKAIRAGQPLPASEAGVVQTLEIIGVIYLIAGIAGAIGALVAAATIPVEDGKNLGPWFIALALALGFQALVIKTLMFALAEIIRKIRIIAEKA